MLWSRDLSKASVAAQILQGLEQRPELPAFDIVPTEQVDFLIITDHTVIGVEIALGSPASTLPFEALSRLEKATYQLPARYPNHALSLALVTNLEVPCRFVQVLEELGIRLLYMPHAHTEAAVANLLMTV